MTRNRFFGVFTGFFITGLVQSSSATTVMTVSFVNAGLLSLVESAGVMMGANIGTTVTGLDRKLPRLQVQGVCHRHPAHGLCPAHDLHA